MQKLSFVAVLMLITESVVAGDLSPFTSFNIKGNYVSAGVGLRGTIGGSIAISGIPDTATIEAAYLYWSFLDNGARRREACIAINSVPLIGTKIGKGPDTCWSRQFSRSFRADVTFVVTGNGGAHPLIL
jgi:hypothetical protein